MSDVEYSLTDLSAFWWNNLEADLLDEDRFFIREARFLLYKDAYNALCKIVTGEEPVDPPPPEESFRENFSAYLEKHKDRLHRQICVEFRYCEKRQKYKQTHRFALLLSAFIVFLLDLKSGGLATATWLTITSQLDDFCGCSPNEAKSDKKQNDK